MRGRGGGHLGAFNSIVLPRMLALKSAEAVLTQEAAPEGRESNRNGMKPNELNESIGEAVPPSLSFSLPLSLSSISPSLSLGLFRFFLGNLVGNFYVRLFDWRCISSSQRRIELIIFIIIISEYFCFHSLHSLSIHSSSTSPFVNLMRNSGSFARSFCARTLPSRPFRRYDDIDDKTQTSLR